MILNDGIKHERATIWRICDYLFGTFCTAGLISLLFGLWQLGSQNFGEFLLPSPHKVLLGAWEILLNDGTNLSISLFRAFVGIGVACAVGIILGLLAGSFKSFAACAKLLNTLLLSMPPIIWVVLALFWFSFGDVSTIFTVIIVTLPLTFASSMIGMMSVRDDLVELFDAYGLGLFSKIRNLYLPHLTSYIISSLSVAFGIGVKIVVMAELLGASDGVGAQIAKARAMLDTTEVMAYVLLCVSLVMLFETIVIEPLKILFMPWKR